MFSIAWNNTAQFAGNLLRHQVPALTKSDSTGLSWHAICQENSLAVGTHNRMRFGALATNNYPLPKPIKGLMQLPGVGGLNVDSVTLGWKNWTTEHFLQP